MKILFWTPIFFPDVGGIQLISMRLIQSLVQRGHEFVVVTSHGRVAAPDFSEEDGFQIYRFPIVSALQDQNLPQLIGIQREIQTIKRTFLPELEHLHFGGPAPIAYLYLRAAATAPAPMILSLHAPIRGLEGGFGSITGQILRDAAWTTGVSRSVLDEARQLVPEILERSSVVYSGIQDTAIKPAQLPFTKVCILCLGRLIREKGFDLAIDAFAEIVQNFPMARMVIAGDGPNRQTLEQQVASLDLGHAVEFIGAYELKDVYDLINQATVVVVPSPYREAFGLVALEASQMARPVVASHVDGLAEVVLDGETGILVEPGGSHAIAQAVIWLLENPEGAVQMGQKGYHRAHTHFSWGRCVNNYENLYMKFEKENL